MTKIIVYGDSYGSSENDGCDAWPDLLRKQTNFKVINNAISGSSTEHAMRAFMSDYHNNKIDSDDIIIFIAAIAPCKTKKLLSDNILIVKNFNKAIKDINISYIIYISSDAVYSDTHKKINEYSKTNPKNLHGIMHLKRERMLLRKNKSKLLIIRPTLIYGPGDPHNGYGPNRFMRLAIVNKNIELFGKGEEVRDHIHIDDVGKIISMLILRRVAGILNLVTSREISFYKIAKIIINNTKSRSKIIHFG